MFGARLWPRAAWVVGFLCSRRSSLRLHRVFLLPNRRIIGRIAGLGIAPFIMQSTESLVTVVLNTGMQTYGGDLYVGSITIMQSVMQMIVMPVQGITQGTQPIMSYNYGARKYHRVRQTFKRLLTITLTVTCAAFLLVALFPGVLARIFTPEPELISLVSRVMPLFFGAAAEGDPAGAPGADPAPRNGERVRDLCRRAHRRHLGQCHHVDPVPHTAEETAAGGGSLLKSCWKSAKLKSLE